MKSQRNHEFSGLNALQSIFWLDWRNAMDSNEVSDFASSKRVSEVKKPRNSPNKKLEKREKLIRSLNAKIERWKRMEQGDEDALWECMYDRGMCSKEDLNEYYKNKKVDD